MISLAKIGKQSLIGVSLIAGVLGVNYLRKRLHVKITWKAIEGIEGQKTATNDSGLFFGHGVAKKTAEQKQSNQ